MDFTTALPSSAFSPNSGGERGVEKPVLVAALADPARRRDAAHALATHLGAEDLLVFSPDAEIGTLLPAPEFPQTLPEGRLWRTFLDECAADGQAAGRLRCPYTRETKQALGFLGSCGSVLVLLGGMPRREDLSEIQALLPLLTAAFRGERTTLTAEGHAAVARNAAAQAETLTKSLDKARKVLGVALEKAKAAAVENARLYEEMRESDRHKDEFLAMLAHELRNPLAPIRSALELIRAKAPPVPELQWARDVIDRQVQQMIRLVDDLLDLSRITTGKIVLRKESVDVASIVKNAIESSRPLIERLNHTLTVTLPPEPVLMEADSTRLAQVLLNLLNNAAKYTEKGGRLSLTVESVVDTVLFRVKDTGIGISPEMLQRVFDMFTQVERSLERSQGGLGIGLTLVRRLVELHGGTVEAHSAGSHQGSEFVVRLPIGSPTRNRTLQVTRDDGSQVDAASKNCILIVDDNRDAADSLAMLLRIRGYEVHTAYDGLEAVKVTAALRPEMVLLDVGLPKLNGYEVARRIRQDQGDSVKLIALTGWGQEDDRRRSAEAGFDHHLTKPVQFDALQRLLAPTDSPDPTRY